MAAEHLMNAIIRMDDRIADRAYDVKEDAREKP
jgi:hypothetical protein